MKKNSTGTASNLFSFFEKYAAEMSFHCIYNPFNGDRVKNQVQFHVFLLFSDIFRLTGDYRNNGNSLEADL